METIYGNLQGLKSNQLKQLQKLYGERQPSDRLNTPELSHTLAAISTSIHQPVCCYINRRGQVIRVGVGTPNQIQIPPQEQPQQNDEHFSGIHCVATQLKPGIPDEATLIAMARQRLDALVVLTVAPNKNGHSDNVKEAYLAHPVPDKQKPWIVSPPLSLDELTEMDFDDLIDEWESEFEEAGYDTFLSQDIVSDRDRVLLVGLIADDVSEQRFKDGIEELVRLVESAGGEVLDTITQKRSKPHPQTVVYHRAKQIRGKGEKGKRRS